MAITVVNSFVFKRRRFASDPSITAANAHVCWVCARKNKLEARRRVARHQVERLGVAANSLKAIQSQIFCFKLSFVCAAAFCSQFTRSNIVNIAFAALYNTKIGGCAPMRH